MMLAKKNYGGDVKAGKSELTKHQVDGIAALGSIVIIKGGSLWKD